MISLHDCLVDALMFCYMLCGVKFWIGHSSKIYLKIDHVEILTFLKSKLGGLPVPLICLHVEIRSLFLYMNEPRGDIFLRL